MISWERRATREAAGRPDQKASRFRCEGATPQKGTRFLRHTKDIRTSRQRLSSTRVEYRRARRWRESVALFLETARTTVAAQVGGRRGTPDRGGSALDDALPEIQLPSRNLPPDAQDAVPTVESAPGPTSPPTPRDDRRGNPIRRPDGVQSPRRDRRSAPLPSKFLTAMSPTKPAATQAARRVEGSREQQPEMRPSVAKTRTSWIETRTPKASEYMTAATPAQRKR